MRNRDLDAEIAELVFKWKYISIGKDYNGENVCQILYNRIPNQDFFNSLPRIGKIHKGWFTPQYSNDLKEAIKLAKYVNLDVNIKDLPSEPEDLARLSLEHWKKNNI